MPASLFNMALMLGWGIVGMLGIVAVAMGIVAIDDHKGDIAAFFSDVFNTIFHPIKKMKERALKRDMKKHPEKYVDKKYYWDLYGIKKEMPIKKWHVQLDKKHIRMYSKDLLKSNKQINKISKKQDALNVKILKTTDNEKSQLLKNRLDALAEKREEYESHKKNREALVRTVNENLDRDIKELDDLKGRKAAIKAQIKAEQEAIIAERTNKSVKTKTDENELSM